MAIALVQSKVGTSAVAVTSGIAFTTTPTNGNLIVLGFASDDYNVNPDAGWTQSAEMEQQTFHGGYLWWRIAAGGTNSFQYSIGSAVKSAYIIIEFSGTDTSTPYDTSQGKFIQASADSIISDAITPSVGNRVLVAVAGFSHGTLDYSSNTDTWDSSFTLISGTGTNTPGERISAAYRLVTGDGSTTYTTTCTESTSPGSPQARSSMVASFKEAGAAAGTSPPFTRNNVFWPAYLVR